MLRIIHAQHLNETISHLVNTYANEMDKYLCAIEAFQQGDEVNEVYAADGERFSYFVVNPIVKVANINLRAAMSMAKQLLIVPVDKDKLPAKPKSEEENPFARLMRRKSGDLEDFD